PVAAAQPAMAAAHSASDDAGPAPAVGDRTSIVLVGASAIDLFASEAAVPVQTRPQPAISAPMRSDDMSVRRGHADLPFQAAPVPTPSPSQPAPASRLSPSYRTLNETSSPQKPQQKSWWSRFRRGASGQRSAVEV